MAALARNDKFLKTLEEISDDMAFEGRAISADIVAHAIDELKRYRCLLELLERLPDATYILKVWPNEWQLFRSYTQIEEDPEDACGETLLEALEDWAGGE